MGSSTSPAAAKLTSRLKDHRIAKGPASNEFGAGSIYSRPAWRLIAHFLNSHSASCGPQATLRGRDGANPRHTRAGQITATDSARINFSCTLRTNNSGAVGL